MADKPRPLSLAERNQVAREVHLLNWVHEKKRNGKWLPKEKYEKVTGKPGRK